MGIEDEQAWLKEHPQAIEQLTARTKRVLGIKPKSGPIPDTGLPASQSPAETGGVTLAPTDSSPT